MCLYHKINIKNEFLDLKLGEKRYYIKFCDERCESYVNALKSKMAAGRHLGFSDRTCVFG